MYENTLDIEGFAQMMKDPSYCYKFYWLEAIVDLISRDITETTFDEIINEMIANAWYSVREFHIHLSVIQADGLVRDGYTEADGNQFSAGKCFQGGNKECYQQTQQRAEAGKRTADTYGSVPGACRVFHKKQ